jgi:uncharacterized protein (TIGR02217 family)
MAFVVDSLLLETGDYLRLEDGEKLAISADATPDVAQVPRLRIDTDSVGVSKLLLENGNGLEMEGITAAVSATVPTFDDGAVFLPVVGRATSGGPGFHTTVQTFAEGGMIMIPRWARPVRSYSYETGLFPSADDSGDTPTHVEDFLNFYRAVRGSLIGFRFDDPFDGSTTANHIDTINFTDYAERHVIGAGDGTTTKFQLVKRYRFGDVERIRPITRPWLVIVHVDGVAQVHGTDITVLFDGGEIDFVVAPGKGSVIEYSGAYHVPCRFGQSADDNLPQTLDFTELSSYGSVPLTEIKENVIFSDHKHTGGYFATQVNVISQSIAINLSDGFVQKFTPNFVGTSTIRTPMVAQLLDGGPVCIIVNGAAAASGKLLSIKTPDAAAEQTVVTTLNEGEHAVLHYHEDGTWIATT